MQPHAWLFRFPGSDVAPAPLVAACGAEQMELADLGPAPDAEDLAERIPQGPGIVFLPALEEDCAGVKLTQNALAGSPPHRFTGPPRVVVLYGRALPSSEFLSLAFREGADDVLALDGPEQTIAIQVRRAVRILAARLDSSHAGGELSHQVEAMREQIEYMERQIARYEERLLALASAALRMASGELRLDSQAPVLLIVSSSRSQADSAREVAERMGFEVHAAHTGQEGLERIVEARPSVILTDGTLPDMDGVAFAHSARQVLGRRAVVVVAWSSNADKEDALLAPDSGIDDFVLKSAGRQTAERLAAAFLGALR